MSRSSIFGADRLANNGSADFGFWFFQSEVVANPNGTFTTATGTPAHHLPGDILLLGTFTQVARPRTSGPSSGSGQVATERHPNDPGVTLSDCDLVSGGDSGCGTVNGAIADPGATSPWNYVTKFSDPSTVTNKNQSKTGIFPSGTLYEGGINLSDFDLEGCFSTFAAETRSSPEIGAQLKDFVLGSFESCGATMTTDASSNSFEIGGSVSDSATINVTGANPPAPTGNVSSTSAGRPQVSRPAARVARSRRRSICRPRASTETTTRSRPGRSLRLLRATTASSRRGRVI